MKKLDEMEKEFGAFYPRGHMVVEFAAEQNAKLVLADLKAQGTMFDDILDVTPQEMIDFAEINITQARPIADLGTSVTTLQNFLNAARTGSWFLVIPTPDDAVADQVALILARVPHGLAQRYHLLAIEDVP